MIEFCILIYGVGLGSITFAMLNFASVLLDISTAPSPAKKLIYILLFIVIVTSWPLWGFPLVIFQAIGWFLGYKKFSRR